MIDRTASSRAARLRMTGVRMYRVAAITFAATLLAAGAGRAAMPHTPDSSSSPLSLSLSSSPSQGAASLKDGVYSDAQATRGKATFAAHCVTCHLELHNSTPPLAGEVFRAKWAPLTVNDLFTKMRETMPTIEPGMLTPAEYIDLVAYVLQENKAPSGAKELTADGPLKDLSLGDLPKP